MDGNRDNHVANRVNTRGGHALSSGFRLFFNKLVPLKSQDEDSRRSEFITNVLLLGTLAISASAFLIQTYHQIAQDGYGANGLPYPLTIVATGAIAALYAFSRRGHWLFAAYGLVTIHLIATTAVTLRWGVELPFALLNFALLIALTGIMLGIRSTIGMTGLIAVLLLTIGKLRLEGIVVPDLAWKNQPVNMSDYVVFILMYAVIATVGWLSWREIIKNLERARRSEAELKVERDNLEIRVEERTRDLKQAQVEKLSQLYRFAEFGRLASGIFHDLINPLTAVSLSLEQVKEGQNDNLGASRLHLQRAFDAAGRMESYVKAVRKQLQTQETVDWFLLDQEASHALQVLAYKAKKARVTLELHANKPVKAFGNPLKFNQVVTNLVSNAIDAYDQTITDPANPRVVEIEIRQVPTKEAELTVRDWGCGIPADALPHIFDPFFTTKTAESGMGIGLSNSRDIVEKNFKGTLSAESRVGHGSIFRVRFPCSPPSSNNKKD